MHVRFELDPVGKPRMTKSDRWRKRPATTKYWAFKDEITGQANEARFQLPDVYGAIFYLPMPKSWSKKQREALRGRPHQQKPDKDNIEKALNDALRGDDSTIWRNLVEKRWADAGAIEIFTDQEFVDYLTAAAKHPTE